MPNLPRPQLPSNSTRLLSAADGSMPTVVARADAIETGMVALTKD
jgi:hypothetical protein